MFSCGVVATPRKTKQLKCDLKELAAYPSKHITHVAGIDHRYACALSAQGDSLELQVISLLSKDEALRVVARKRMGGGEASCFQVRSGLLFVGVGDALRTFSLPGPGSDGHPIPQNFATIKVKAMGVEAALESPAVGLLFVA